MSTQEERAARIKAVRNKSLKLMQMDANGTLGKIAESKRGDINQSIEGGDIQFASSAPQTKDLTRPIQTNRMSVAANNVPSIIRESFQANPPMAQQDVSSSVLDDVFGDVLTENTQPKRTVQRITETTQSVNSSQIDYPMIRTIVEEIVRKYTSSLGKKMLNENKQGEINTIAFGKSFKFLDNAGNIYECTMKKVGNVHDKKG